jgi:hypothetical protein
VQDSNSKRRDAVKVPLPVPWLIAAFDANLLDTTERAKEI